MNYSLLTEDELKAARGQGLPSDVDDRYVKLSGGKSPREVVFTVRGIQYYRYVLNYWGVSASLGDIKTVEDLLTLTLKVNDKMQFPNGMPEHLKAILEGRNRTPWAKLKRSIDKMFREVRSPKA